MKLKESIESVQNSFRTDSDPFPENLNLIEDLRVKYMGRKGLVAGLFLSMKNVSSEDRPDAGKLLNGLKQEIISVLDTHRNLSESDNEIKGESDYTLPGLKFSVGHIHPLQQLPFLPCHLLKSLNLDLN